jgi:hypothetical protein
MGGPGQAPNRHGQHRAGGTLVGCEGCRADRGLAADGRALGSSGKGRSTARTAAGKEATTPAPPKEPHTTGGGSFTAVHSLSVPLVAVAVVIIKIARPP